MPIRRRRPHLAWLRTLLLASLVVVVAAVVGLFLFGRAGQEREKPPVAQDASQATEGTVLVGRDFDYTYTEGNRPLFRIKGDSIRADREETIYLDGVGLTLYDPQGRAYQAESKVASFNRARNEGELAGGVHLQGPSGLDFRSEALQIAEKGHVLLSNKPVQIGFQGQYTAHAESLRFHLEEELYVLSGKVVVRSNPEVVPPVLMRSEQLVYERPRRQVRIEGKAFLARGADHLEAGRIAAFLSQDEKEFTFVRALWNVAGRVETEEDRERTRLRFTAQDLGVAMEPGSADSARQIELDSPGRGGVTIHAVGGGVTRVLSSKRVVARMAQGVLHSASAFRGVEVRETATRGKPERRVTGEQADLGFQPDGQIAAATLAGPVEYVDGDVKATGERGQMDFAAGRGEFFGDPVDVRSPRGHLVAPHVVYTRADGLLHGDGGVRAVMEQGDPTLAASLPGEGEGPVRVESREAFWREQPRSVLFKGDVRAWRGESVLTARDLRGDQEGTGEAGKVTATGGVKSLWVPAPETGKSAPAKGTAGSGPAAPRQPIEITAAQLVYTRAQGAGGAAGSGAPQGPTGPAGSIGPTGSAGSTGATGSTGAAGATGLLTYTGGVRVEQESRTLTCEQLAVSLSPQNRAETMTCTGQTRLTDPQTGRNVEGQRAVYHVADRLVEVFGDPVTMRDRDGNQVRGRRLLYHMEDGRVEVKGQGAPAAAGTGGTSGASAER